jgi:potassium-transporting ATPase potassium-binding subunit
VGPLSAIGPRLQRGVDHLPLRVLTPAAQLRSPVLRPANDEQPAWNTAVSFVTNTNWQSYSGESALGYIEQIAGLAVQNFASAAVGVAVAIALCTRLRPEPDRSGRQPLGRPDADRPARPAPIAVVFAIVFVGAGMIQSFHDYHTITTIAGGQQTLPGGPVASQEVIKELGTNGGGFFNANSAHLFKNPTTWTRWLEIFLLLCISFSLRRR